MNMKGESRAKASADGLSTDKVKLLQILLAKRGDKGAIEKVARVAVNEVIQLPASSAQRRMWLVDQMEGGGAAYHIPMAMRLRGNLDELALRRSLDALVQRHEVLRTTFSLVGEDLKQCIAVHRPFPLEAVDLSDLENSLQLEQIALQKELESAAMFDLNAGPLIRGRLLRLDSMELLLLITVHHIVFDGWSMGIFLNELQELYRAYHQGQQPSLPALEVQYADYARWHEQWLQSGVLEQQLEYWRERLRESAFQLELPTDRPRPATQSYRGGYARLSMGAQLSAQLRSFAQRHKLTQFMIFYAAWAALLYRLTDQQDILIATPVANRRRPEIEGLIGFFVNTLVLRARIDDQLSVDRLLAQAQKTVIEAFDHQDVPFEKLVEVLHPHRTKGHNPIFQVMLAVNSEPEGTLSLPGLDVSNEEGIERGAMFDLLLHVDDSSEEIIANLNYAADIFSEETAHRWLQSLRCVLRTMVIDVRVRVSELTMLSEEQVRAIDAFRQPSMVPSTTRLVHEVFEQQVLRCPDAIALTCEDRSLTYAQLNEKANQLAWLLRSKGVGCEKLVAICVERHLMMIVGILGILKAGGAYVPLDPQYPRERLNFMIEDAAPAVLLIDEHLPHQLSSRVTETLVMGAAWDELEGWPTENVPLTLTESTPASLAYVIYTSGSTGKPKGVMVEHGNVDRLFTATKHWFAFSERDVWTLFHSFAFDFSVWELWGALLHGGRVVIVPHLVARSPDEFYRLVCRERVTVLNQTPSAFTQLIDAQERNVDLGHSLRVVVFGGEALDLRMLRRWIQRNDAGRPQLVNMYGITETTVHVTYQPMTAEQILSEHSSIIGKPIPDLQLHLLDRQRNPVPIGVAGEIYVGGAGVARGYLNRPELTEERFISNLRGESRLYKSGDLGRWRSDGQIEYLGRNDHQVKIRGFRIELGEIQAQIQRHAMVRDAVVVATNDPLNERRLVAYLVPATATGDQHGLPLDEIRTHLRAVLPDYMVPSAFVLVESLPITLNGKLDTRALPAPDWAGEMGRQYEAPTGDLEEALARVWQELLGLERVGRRDNFFEVGGHSMLAVKTLFRINESMGYALQVADIYRHPTITELAAHIRDGAVLSEEFVDLERESSLGENVRSTREEFRELTKEVLLTGATGFVGRFLLARLLQEERLKVYCLVRAKSERQGISRIKGMLLKWDLWRDEYEQRIIAVPGDLRLPALGMNDRVRSRLAHSIDVIYHCATSMNHLETYAMAKAANVDAVRELLRFSVLGKTKLVNYVSTLSVFSPVTSDIVRVIDEKSSIDSERHSVASGYAASKWVGEKIVMNALDQGIPCNIFRLGLVWADAHGGRYDELQNVYRVIKSSVLSGKGIEGYLSDVVATPVDFVADAIVRLSSTHRAGGGVFHVCSPQGCHEGIFERSNAMECTSLELMPYFKWIGEMKRLHQRGWSLPAVPLIEFAFSMSQKAFDRYQHDSRSEKLSFGCEETARILAEQGIVAPILSDEMIAACLDTMRRKDPDLLPSTESVSVRSGPAARA